MAERCVCFVEVSETEARFLRPPLIPKQPGREEMCCSEDVGEKGHS